MVVDFEKVVTLFCIFDTKHAHVTRPSGRLYFESCLRPRSRHLSAARALLADLVTAHFFLQLNYGPVSRCNFHANVSYSALLEYEVTLLIHNIYINKALDLACAEIEPFYD